MSDAIPNYNLEIQRKKMEITAQEANIEKQLFDVMNWQDQIHRHNTNIESSKKAILELKENLKSLEKAHSNPEISKTD